MNQQSSQSIIRVNGLSKKFRKTLAVDNISFSVHKGEIIGFVGMNGAGKTTTISMLLGLIAPTKGSIEILREKITPAKSYKSHNDIGYASGDMELFDGFTAKQYLDFVRAQKSHHSDKRFHELCDLFKPELSKKIADLSRGNKQKIALIAAFMCEPQLIILDEPTSGLDPAMQDVFLQVVREEQKRGATIFMSSHYIAEIEAICTRVLLLKNGVLVKDVSAQNLKNSSGKQVRVVSNSRIITLPQSDLVSLKKVVGEYRLSAVYHGDAKTLQSWIMRLKGIKDISIEDHNTDAAFRHLYTDEVEKINE